MSVKLLAFAASLRKASLNRKLLTQAVAVAERGGATVEVAEFAEFDMPLFNADLQAVSGFPPGAVRMQQRLEQAHGILLASPEYNYSLPGTLKNAIDWVSRMRPVPLRGKSALLMATSSSAFAQQHAVDPGALATAVTQHIATQDADRAAVRDALAQPQVREIARAKALARNLSGQSAWRGCRH